MSNVGVWVWEGSVVVLGDSHHCNHSETKAEWHLHFNTRLQCSLRQEKRRLKSLDLHTTLCIRSNNLVLTRVSLARTSHVAMPNFSKITGVTHALRNRKMIMSTAESILSMHTSEC